MENYTWDYKILKPSDLPEKAQRFIEIMDIDTTFLRLMILKADPNGVFNKSFDKLNEKKPGNDWSAIAETDAIFFFDDYPTARTAIHELTHIYLYQSRYEKGHHDLEAICENFIALHGEMTLTDYAYINFLEDDWDEVICEIVATYGSEGQFDKIKELFNPEIHAIADEELPPILLL